MNPDTEFREPPVATDSEAARLREVRRFAHFNQPFAAVLEPYCQLAAAVFSAPLAAVTLVDETETRVVASHGPVIGTLPRERSLCSCVILRSDVYVLRDLDAELGDLRVLPGPEGFSVRFYVAVPLATSSGHNVGTLFVADWKPRDVAGADVTRADVTDAQVEALATLGRLVTEQMERGIERSDSSGSVDDPLDVHANLIRLLAKGAAHDYRELITGWIGTMDALEQELRPGSEARDLAGQLNRSLLAAARFTDHLKAFASGIPDPADAVPLNLLVESVTKMLRSVVRRSVLLKTRLDRAVDGIKLDTRNLEWALAAFVHQVDKAMHDGGNITVSTGLERFDEPHSTPFVDLLPGLYATITIAHDGRALDPQQRRELTNLANDRPASTLAWAAEIVTRLGASIDICTAPDLGESITVYLPVSWRSVPPPADSLEEGKFHILLVENHEVVLRGIHSALRRRGYRVTTAENGADALRKFPDAQGFDMVVTDVVMHPMDGVAMVQKLREKRPELLVIFLSGYDKVGVDSLSLTRGTRFLAKPFTAEALVQQVTSLLPDPEFEA
jgi:CheY-like chemotaxis protein